MQNPDVCIKYNKSIFEQYDPSSVTIEINSALSIYDKTRVLQLSIDALMKELKGTY